MNQSNQLREPPVEKRCCRVHVRTRRELLVRLGFFFFFNLGVTDSSNLIKLHGNPTQSKHGLALPAVHVMCTIITPLAGFLSSLLSALSPNPWRLARSLDISALHALTFCFFVVFFPWQLYSVWVSHNARDSFLYRFVVLMSRSGVRLDCVSLKAIIGFLFCVFYHLYILFNTFPLWINVLPCFWCFFWRSKMFTSISSARRVATIIKQNSSNKHYLPSVSHSLHHSYCLFEELPQQCVSNFYHFYHCGGVFYYRFHKNIHIPANFTCLPCK